MAWMHPELQIPPPQSPGSHWGRLAFVSTSSGTQFSPTPYDYLDSSVREWRDIVTPEADALFHGIVWFCYFLLFNSFSSPSTGAAAWHVTLINAQRTPLNTMWQRCPSELAHLFQAGMGFLQMGNINSEFGPHSAQCILYKQAWHLWNLI